MIKYYGTYYVGTEIYGTTYQISENLKFAIRVNLFKNCFPTINLPLNAPKDVELKSIYLQEIIGVGVNNKEQAEDVNMNMHYSQMHLYKRVKSFL